MVGIGDRKAQRVGEARHGLPALAHSRTDRHDAEVDQGGAAAAQLDGRDPVELEHGRGHLTRCPAEPPDRERGVLEERPGLDGDSCGRGARLAKQTPASSAPPWPGRITSLLIALASSTSVFEPVLVGVAVSTVAPALLKAVTVGAAPVWASVTSTLVAARGSWTSVDVATSQPT